MLVVDVQVARLADHEGLALSCCHDLSAWSSRSRACSARSRCSSTPNFSVFQSTANPTVLLGDRSGFHDWQGSLTAPGTTSRLRCPMSAPPVGHQPEPFGSGWKGAVVHRGEAALAAAGHGVVQRPRRVGASSRNATRANWLKQFFPPARGTANIKGLVLIANPVACHQGKGIDHPPVTVGRCGE